MTQLASGEWSGCPAAAPCISTSNGPSAPRWERIRGTFSAGAVVLSLALAGCSGGGSGDGGGGGGGGAGAVGSSGNNGQVTVSLQASAPQIANGGTVNLSWTGVNADSCTASGAWNGDLAASGLKQVGPLGANSTFKLTCRNSFFSGEASTTVNVTFAAGQLRFDRIVIDNGLAPFAKAFGDLDGDGFQDIIVAGGSVLGEQIYWYRYVPATNSFTRHLLNEFGGGDHVIAIDMNGDGRNDIVSVTQAKVSWFENPGPANVTQPWTVHNIDTTFGAHDLVVADMNNDTHFDVLVRSEFGGEVRMYLRNAANPSTWLPPVSFSASNGFPFSGLGLAVADIDGNGPDIVLNGMWLRNPGAANVATASMWTVHDFAANRAVNWPDAAVAIADIDNDGKLDIVLSRSPLDPTGGTPVVSPITWFKGPAANPAAGVWASQNVIDVTENVHDVQIVDLDKDGKLDVVFGEMFGGNVHRIGIAFGNGGASWTLQVLSTDGSHGIAIGDFDKDSNLDMLGANVTTSSPDGGALSLWRGLGKQN